MKLVLLILSIFCLKPACFGQNLLENADFEKDVLNWHSYSNADAQNESVASSGLPDASFGNSQKEKQPINAPVFLEISDEQQNNGSNSLHLSMQSESYWAARNDNFYEIEAGAVYELHAFASLEKMKQQTGMSLVFFDKNKKELQKSNKTPFFLTGESNWQVFVSELIIPNESAFAKIEINGKDSTELWLDDVVLKKSALTNLQGDYSVENDLLKVTLHLPSYSIQLYDKVHQENHNTKAAEGFTTEKVFIRDEAIHLNGLFLTENMAIEMVFSLEDNVLKIEMTPAQSEAPMFNDFEFPGAITAKKGQKMVVPNQGNQYFPAEQAFPAYSFLLNNPKKTIGFAGVKGEKDAYFISTENPETAGFSFPANGDDLHEPQIFYGAENGNWGHKRTTYIGVTNNDYESMTKWFHAFAAPRDWARPQAPIQKDRYIVKILPNPAIDVINITFDATLPEKAVLLVHDVNGKNLLTTTLESGLEAYRLDVVDFKSGLYQIHLLFASGKQQTLRFLKN
jgi:hypothetical protein